MAQKIATTDIARQKYAQALAGEITLPSATQIAFGDNGADTQGDPRDIDTSWTTVPGELLKKSLDSIASSDNITDMLGVLTQDELNGEEISAAGIYDAEGDLLAIATFNPIPKDSDDRIELDWDTIF